MRFGHIIKAAVIVLAAFMLVASASASTINWNDNGAGTVFTSYAGYTLLLSGTELSYTSGSTNVLLHFVANSNPNNANASGSNVSYGDFWLSCTNCATGVTLPAFTFHLVVNELTSNGLTTLGSGVFTGTSTGGAVSASGSSVQVSWTPTQLGTGTNNALSGNFGTDYFTYPSSGLTLIVAPNSNGGDTTIQGIVNDTTASPEPATMALAGSLLIGLAALARKRRA